MKYLEDDNTTEILYGGGAGGGKSILGCYWLLKNSIKYPRSKWLMSRNNQKTLKETTYQSFLKVCELFGLKAGIHFTVNGSNHKEQPDSIVFQNGSSIIMKGLEYLPSDPLFSRLGSLEITGAFIDECNEIHYKAKEIVQTRMRHNLDKYGIKPKLLMTCNPAKNWVYTEFYKPHKEGNIKEYQKFVQALVTDNPDIDRNYIENLERAEQDTRERLLLGNWEYDDDPRKLLSYNDIMNLFTNTFVHGNGKKYITADIAMEGNDKFIVFVWDGFKVIEIGEYSKKNGNEVELILKELAAKHRVPQTNITFDSDGVGRYLRGYLANAMPFVNGSSPLFVNGIKEVYANLKSQCAFLMAEKIRANEVFISNCTQDQKRRIMSELEYWKDETHGNESPKRLLKKQSVIKDLKHSPDYSDNLIFRMIFELKGNKISLQSGKY